MIFTLLSSGRKTLLGREQTSKQRSSRIHLKKIKKSHLEWGQPIPEPKRERITQMCTAFNLLTKSLLKAQKRNALASSAPREQIPSHWAIPAEVQRRNTGS